MAIFWAGFWGASAGLVVLGTPAVFAVGAGAAAGGVTAAGVGGVTGVGAGAGGVTAAGVGAGGVTAAGAGDFTRVGTAAGAITGVGAAAGAFTGVLAGSAALVSTGFAALLDMAESNALSDAALGEASSCGGAGRGHDLGASLGWVGNWHAGISSLGGAEGCTGF